MVHSFIKYGKNLAQLHIINKKYKQGVKEINEAMSIYRHLEEKNPSQFHSEVERAEKVLTILYERMNHPDEKETTTSS